LSGFVVGAADAVRAKVNAKAGDKKVRSNFIGGGFEVVKAIRCHWW
jgi:hypothetical protein